MVVTADEMAATTAESVPEPLRTGNSVVISRMTPARLAKIVKTAMNAIMQMAIRFIESVFLSFQSEWRTGLCEITQPSIKNVDSSKRILAF
jgi:hypothetical protein